MSQYFSPRQRTRRFSTVSERTEDTSATASSIYYDAEEIQAHEVDLEQSIYIFPNPGVSSGVGSGPSSPFATSSELSVPTDISFPSSTEGGSRTRDGRGRRTISNVSAGTGSGWEVLSGRSASEDTGLHSPSVEVWDMSYDEEALSGASSDIGSAELEDAIERASRWDVLHARPSQRPERRYPLGRQPFRNPFTYAEGRFQFRRRFRRVSSASLDTSYKRTAKKGSSRSAHSLGRDSLSLPRLSNCTSQLPLLSVLCSFFSLDDATVRLLTRSVVTPSSSPLFPGPRLYPDEDEEDDKSFRTARGSLARLGSSELESAKEGIEVVCDPSITPNNKLALPLPSFPILGLWNLVTGVCSIPIKAWTHVRRPSRPIPASSG